MTIGEQCPRRNRLSVVLQGEVRDLEAQLTQTRTQAAEAERALRLNRHEASKAAHLLRERSAQLLRVDVPMQPDRSRTGRAVQGHAAAASAARLADAGQATGGSKDDVALQMPLEESQDAQVSGDVLLAQLHQAQMGMQDHQRRLQEAVQQVQSAQQQATEETDRRAALEAAVASKDAALADMRSRLRELNARHVAPSGKGALKCWDNLIEEAAGQLSGVEEQLRTASEQLLTLQGCHAHKQAASAAAARERSAAELAAKECAAAREDLHRMRADVSTAEAELQRLHGELAAGRATLHDQRQAHEELQQERACASEQALEARSAVEAARAELQAAQEQVAEHEERMAPAQRELEAVHEQSRQVAFPSI